MKRSISSADLDFEIRRSIHYLWGVAAIIACPLVPTVVYWATKNDKAAAIAVGISFVSAIGFNIAMFFKSHLMKRSKTSP